MTPEEQIDAITLAVLQQGGVDMAADIQDSLDDSYPPPSSPGTPPHRRSGLLQELVESYVIQEGSIITLYIVSLAPYSRYLEGGTEKMKKRPFMLPAANYWFPILQGRLSSAFSVGPVVSTA